MPFFEDIGRKLSNVGQGMAQQTRNIADTTRLNGAVSERERRLAQLFQAVGQAYYQRHAQDPAAEERESLNEITRLYQEIEQYRREINQIRGLAICPTCGAGVPVQAAFCNACGTRMPPQQMPAPAPVQANMRVCPTCGAQVSMENRFCNYCGTNMDAPQPPVQMPPVPPAPTMQEADPMQAGAPVQQPMEPAPEMPPQEEQP